MAVNASAPTNYFARDKDGFPAPGGSVPLVMVLICAAESSLVTAVIGP